MVFVKDKIVKTSLLISVILAVTINVSGASSGEKTLNIKIGFDLIEGSNGPSLRIRNVEDTLEPKKRADEKNSEESHHQKPAIRADLLASASGSGESPKNAPSAPKQADRSESDDKSESNSDDYSGPVQYSTRGMMNSNENEPEEGAEAIKKFVPASSDSDSDSKDRHKRSVFLDHLMPREKY